MSASVTGLPRDLCQLLYWPPKYLRAIAPASRTFATSRSRSSVSSGTRHRHSIDAQRGRIGAVAEHEIVRGRQMLVHVLEIARDRDLTDRIGDFAVLDPEACRATRIVAGDAVHAHADQLGHVEALAHVLHQLSGRLRARDHVEVR